MLETSSPSYGLGSQERVLCFLLANKCDPSQVNTRARVPSVQSHPQACSAWVVNQSRAAGRNGKRSVCMGEGRAELAFSWGWGLGLAARPGHDSPGASSASEGDLNQD